MQVDVLLNAKAGTSTSNECGAIADKVHASLEAAGVTANVRVLPGAELQSAARASAARGVDAVVAAGGDGTVNAVAAALAGGNTPLGLLPMGTLNHFAKDNNIPLDLEAAAQVIAANNVRVVDVGRVNERIFVNNSSLGVYAEALIDRDAQRDQNGTSKWVAMLLASWKVFRRSPLLRVQLTIDGQKTERKTPLVFVGNNEYQLELFRIGSRARLDDGLLSLYIAHTHSRWGMLKLGMRAAFGRLRQSRDFEISTVESVHINSRRSKVNVAVDGEVAHLSTPVKYSIWPRGLRVIVPPPEGASGTTNVSGDA
jgi:diacylglycerol kinase family enzyme